VGARAVLITPLFMFRCDPYPTLVPSLAGHTHVLACDGPLHPGRSVAQAAHWAADGLGLPLAWLPSCEGVWQDHSEQAWRDRSAGASLVVLGREAQPARRCVVEQVVQTVSAPVLAVADAGAFAVPERVMVAFDGSPASRRAVAWVASSPLMRGVHCHLMMAGHVGQAEAARELERAQTDLMTAGLRVTCYQVLDEVVSAMQQGIGTYRIDLLVMGAFSHAPWRRWVAGSCTTRVLRACTVPTVLVR